MNDKAVSEKVSGRGSLLDDLSELENAEWDKAGG